MFEYDWIFDEVSSGIKALIDRFTQTPYFFYSEQDMHAYLYHKLVSGKLGECFVETSTGDRSILVHREYPTLSRYRTDRSEGKRGRFDLVVLDPTLASESHWRTQEKKRPYSRHKPKVAVEFGLNEIGTTRLDLTHFKKDLERLTNPANKVERGYLLFFVRRDDYSPNSGMLKIISQLPERLEQELKNVGEAGNLVVIYAKSPSSEQPRIIAEDQFFWTTL